MADTLPGLPPGQPRRLAAGAALFRAGDPAIGLVQVRSGELELRRPGPEGRAAPMQRARPGDTLAEASLFETHHHCDAVALRASEVTVLGRAALERAAQADPALPWRLAAYLARRLVESRARAEVLALPGAEARLLAALRLRPAGPDSVRPVGGPWRMLAEECGLSDEATYRALARLERAGALRRHPGAPAVTLRVPD